MIATLTAAESILRVGDVREGWLSQRGFWGPPPPPALAHSLRPLLPFSSSVPLEGVGLVGRERDRAQGEGCRVRLLAGSSWFGDYRALQFCKRKMGERMGSHPGLLPKAAESPLTLGSSWCLQNPAPNPSLLPPEPAVDLKAELPEVSWVTHCLSP